MSGDVIRGPEPPFVGAVYRARRGQRGYEVTGEHAPDQWRLMPIGSDVMKGAGGVTWLTRSTAVLRDRKKWRFIGVAAAALPGEDGTT